MWDGNVYANCLLEFAYGSSLRAIACADHPTQAYLGALLPGQLIAPGSSLALHLANLALHVLALWGLGRVLGVCLHGSQYARLRAIVLCAAAVHPVVLGTLFHTNPDTGVYVFALVLLGTTIGAPPTQRTLPVLLAGLGLCFSKEAGIAVTLVIAAGALVAAPRWRAWRGLLALGLPPLLAVSWIAWARMTGIQKPWAGGGPGALLLGFAPFAWGDPTFRASLFGIFVLGFGWLVTGTTLAEAVVGAARLIRRAPSRAPSGFDGRAALVLTGIAALVTLGLTTYHTFHNLRYFLLLYPLWMLAGAFALVRLNMPARMREGVAAAWLGANLLSAWTSVDPVSRAFYGTFNAGGLRMYNMTSFTGECCGRGQDQLVYNLQYTGFSQAQDALYAAITPRLETIIAGPGPVNWYSFTQLDSVTHARTLSRTGAYLPIFTDHSMVLRNRQRVQEFWFMDMPNADNDAVLRNFSVYYDQTNTVMRSALGVTITARKFVRR